MFVLHLLGWLLAILFAPKGTNPPRVIFPPPGVIWSDKSPDIPHFFWPKNR